MTEALLNYAARREHVARVIAPALAAGQWVLSDRFADSTMAYQGFGHGLGRKAIEALHRAAIGRLAPDLTIILDIPVREGLARAAARRGREDRYENMEAGFHERVRRGFRAIARRETRRCVLLDARLPPEALQEEIRSVVARRLARALAR
jgi:dTMP kinase